MNLNHVANDLHFVTVFVSFLMWYYSKVPIVVDFSLYKIVRARYRSVHVAVAIRSYGYKMTAEESTATPVSTRSKSKLNRLRS